MGSEHCAPGLIASFSSTSPLAVQYQFQCQKSSVGSTMRSRAMPIERHIDASAVMTRAQSIMMTMPVGSPSASTVRSAALSM